MASRLKFATPDDLADYLETGVKKAKQHLGDEKGGRCCLGHYCDLEHIAYSGDSDMFEPGKVVRGGVNFEQDDNGWGEGKTKPRLPDDHWLFTEVPSSNPEADYDVPLQEDLAWLNDNTRGFSRVIKRLRQFAK